MQRADFNADFVATNGGDNGLHRFQGKARLVFDAAAVFVVALVAGIGEELLRQVAIGGVEFDAIESGFDGIFCRLGVIGNDLPDFGAREDVAAARLQRVLPDWQAAAVPVYALTASRLLPAKSRCFIAFLKANAPQ